MAEYDNFHDWQAAVDRLTAEVWAANGGGLAFDPINPGIGVSHVLQVEEDDELGVRMARVDTFQRLMDFLWADGPNPLLALKRLFAITRCGSPGHLAHMNQSEVAVLLNETRAAMSAREMRVWEHFLKAAGFFGTRRPLKKSDEARATYAAVQKGNVNREGGKRAVRKFSVLREKHDSRKRPNKKNKRKTK